MVNYHSSACQRQSLLCSCKWISTFHLQLENGETCPTAGCLCVSSCVLYFTRVVSCSASVFQFMLDKPAYKSETRAGNCTAWSMAYSRTGKCRQIRPSVGETIHLTRSLTRLVPENTYPGLYLSTWSRPLLVRHYLGFWHVVCGSINRRGENWHLQATVSSWTIDHW